jgi:hypothetical protein
MLRVTRGKFSADCRVEVFIACEIEGRRDAAYDRVAKEIAEEADRLIERKQK